MTLAVASRNVSGVLVVRLKGRITMGDGSVQIREAIRESIDNGQTRILLDLGDVNYIDSSGLGELVAGYTTAANRGARGDQERGVAAHLQQFAESEPDGQREGNSQRGVDESAAAGFQHFVQVHAEAERDDADLQKNSCGCPRRSA